MYTYLVLTATLHADQDLIALRQEAHWWKSLHARAIKREKAWKNKVHELEKALRHEKARTSKLARYIETLEARIALLQKQTFGRKSEKTQSEVRYYRQDLSTSFDGKPRKRGNCCADAGRRWRKASSARRK